MGCRLCKPYRDDVRMNNNPNPDSKGKRCFRRLKRWVITKANKLLNTEYRPDSRLLHFHCDVRHTIVNERLDSDRFGIDLAKEQPAEKNGIELDLSKSVDKALRDPDCWSMTSSDTLYGILDIPYDTNDTQSQNDCQSLSSSLSTVLPVSFSTEDESDAWSTITADHSIGNNSPSLMKSLSLVTPTSLTSEDVHDAFNDTFSTMTFDRIVTDYDLGGQLIIGTEAVDDSCEICDEQMMMKDWRVREDRKRRQREDERRCNEEKMMAEKDEKELLEMIEQLEAMAA